MKFLLVTTIKKDAIKVWTCQETTPVGSLHPPVDLASIAATIRQKGHDATIVDLRLFSEPISKYKEVLDTYKPDMVITNLTTTFALDDYYLFSFTPPGIKKAVFGTHSMSVPEECFENNIDFILHGDPEQCVIHLIENNLDGEKCAGVGTKNTPLKAPALVPNLDDLPFPALDLLDMNKYKAPYMKSSRFTILLSGRGCPFPCNFCFIPNYFGKRGRQRSPQSIVEEMKHNIEKYGISEYFFLDATFNLNPRRVEEICDAIIASGLKVSWMCQNRVYPWPEEMVKKMAQAGCVRALFGIEDPDLYDEVKKFTTMEQNINAFKLCKKYRIKTVALTMVFDRPGFTIEQYEKHYFEMLKKLDADAFQCNAAIPFPGTELFDIENKKGTLSRDWSLYDPNGKNALPYATNIDLIKLKDRIYAKTIFYRPIAVLEAVKEMNPRGFASIAKTYVKHAIKAF